MRRILATLAMVIVIGVFVTSLSPSRRIHAQESKMYSDEPSSAKLIPIIRYSLNRNSAGEMDFRLYSHGSGGRKVNHPSEELVALVDYALKHSDKMTTNFYVVGSNVGIVIQGETRNASDSEGRAIVRFRLRRVSDGRHVLELDTETSFGYASWCCSWDTALAAVKSFASSESSMLKLVKHSGGSNVLTITDTFDF